MDTKLVISAIKHAYVLQPSKQTPVNDTFVVVVVCHYMKSPKFRRLETNKIIFGANEFMVNL
jgi:hypothetical protein